MYSFTEGGVQQCIRVLCVLTWLDHNRCLLTYSFSYGTHNCFWLDDVDREGDSPHCFAIFLRIFNINYNIFGITSHWKSTIVRRTLPNPSSLQALQRVSLSLSACQNIEPETCLATGRRANHLARHTQNATSDKSISTF